MVLSSGFVTARELSFLVSDSCLLLVSDSFSLCFYLFPTCLLAVFSSACWLSCALPVCLVGLVLWFGGLCGLVSWPSTCYTSPVWKVGILIPSFAGEYVIDRFDWMVLPPRWPN